MVEKENFMNKFSLEERKKESEKIKKKYPDRIPVIVEKDKNSELSDIDKHKFLVPSNITSGQFLYIIRKRIKLSSDKALFIFVNGILPPTSESMSNIYEDHKAKDGFLYVRYQGENTFG